jgi:hypothetical protein
MGDHKQRLEEILAEWDLNQGKDVDTYSIDLSNVHSNVSITSPYTYTGTIGAGFPNNTIYTTSGTGTSNPWSVQRSIPKIRLDGEDADIEINGWSLVQAIKRIEARLDLFQPNPELESEWEELRSLGEQYRTLEQQLKDKQATWDRLKAMPPPEID